MGVHGLTTFVSSYRDQYKEKIYIRDSPVLIDGCNLMYFLYFDGKHPVVEKGPKKIDKGQTKSPSKINLPDSYLFGGDWETYAQNVRYFFQQLKQCNVTPVVLMDGAYDASKLEVATTRFAQAVKENVKSPKGTGGGPSFPGKSYTPVFLKTVFLEVLEEQKVPHHQTVGEADATIAYIAKLLGECPILSSDSDFLIYTNAKAIPLTTLKFGKAKPSKIDRSNSNSSNDEKVWTLQAEFVSLPKLCHKEFKMHDPRLLGLAAVILGNDKVHTSVFKNLYFGGGSNGDLKQRIARVMQWLSGQRSVGTAMKTMLDNLPSNRRESIYEAIKASLDEYDGEGGEHRIWEDLRKQVELEQWVNADLVNQLEISIQCFADLNLSVGNNDEETDEEIQNQSPKITIPNWFEEAHINCKLQTYHMNLLKNHIVFLTPQIELYQRPTCHDQSIPIIQCTAGILVGDPEVAIELITHYKNRVIRKSINPIVTIPDYGHLPTLLPLPDRRNLEDLENNHEARLDTIFASLGFSSNKQVCKFIESWPASYRIWIATLLYYFKTEIMEDGFTPHDRVAVTLAIFMNILKALVINPGSTIRNSAGNPCISSLNSLYESTTKDQMKLYSIRKFYQTLENLTASERKHFHRAYDIKLTNAMSKYVCVLYHAEMLNNLLGNPMKSPKIRYTLNNFFVYRFAERVSSSIFRVQEKSDLDAYKELVSDVVDIEEMREIVTSFLETFLVL